MTSLERSAMAFVAKLLLTELGGDEKKVITSPRWHVHPIGQSYPERVFLPIHISWHDIEFEDEQSKRKFWMNKDKLKNKNEGIILNDDRNYNEIRITAIYTTEMKVEDGDGRYDIMVKSLEDVEVYSHTTRRTFKFKVKL